MPAGVSPLLLLPANCVSRVRTRLWQGGGLLGVFLLTLILGNFFLSNDRAVTRGMLGYDFTAFYAGGTFVREGHPQLLYDLDAVRANEVQTLQNLGLQPADSVGPWWNPPFYAWVFAPLAALPFPRALAVWTCITMACLAVSIVLLCRMLIQPRSSDDVKRSWRDWGLIPLLMLVSMPFLQAASHGQNSFTSLLLVTLVVVFWRAGQGMRAGLIAGLLFYKPQLGAVLAGMLVLTLGWRALAGVGITGVFLLTVNLVTLPGTLSTYLHRLPSMVHYMQVERAYLWERHVTLKAFWRLLLQGRGPGEALWLVNLLTLAGCAALGLGLLASVRRWRRSIGGTPVEAGLSTAAVSRPVPNPLVGYRPSRRKKARRASDIFRPLDVEPAGVERLSLDAIIAATITCMPLLMPFYFDYDLMLLAVPAVLQAGERLREAQTLSTDRWLVRAWAALYGWMLINPGMTSMTHFNLSVPLLSAVAGLSLVRALRPVMVKSAARGLPTPKPRPLAA